MEWKGRIEMKVLVLGANGQIARLAEKELTQAKISQRLFLRNPSRIEPNELQEVVAGDATNLADLQEALNGIEIVYANLAGQTIEQQARNVVQAMKEQRVKRLIWISTLGIYDEVPGNYGKWNHQMLDGGYLETYSAAAKVIEESDLDYTIIRPAWLSNKAEVDYELTQKGEPFRGTEVSRQSIAALVTKLILNPDEHLHESLGVNKPNTDGDKPAWY